MIAGRQNTEGDPQFLQALNDISAILGNAGQMASLATGVLNLLAANQEYEQVQAQLGMVMIQRELIMRHFDSIDNFIRLAYSERALILQQGGRHIKEGLKKRDYVEVFAGLQIVKAVLLANPLNRQDFDPVGYRDIYRSFNSGLI